VECRFDILGPPEIWRGEQGVVMAPRLWCVFVSFLLTPNVAVPTDVLIDRWQGEAPSVKARASLRSYISRIGGTLKQATGSDAIIEPRGPGYALIVAPDRVDLHRFRSLKRQADAVAASGDSRHAALLLGEAEALWRGEALAGLPGDWIGRMRHSLEQERRAATVQRIELGLRQGRHVDLLGDLIRLSDQYPLDETLIGHLMTSLYRSGRPADALRVYRDARNDMVEQGIDPGPHLTELYQRILRHDPILGITPAYRRPDHASQPNALPADIRDFVGRDQQIQQLTEPSANQNSPLVRVIQGTAGVGKTVLAVRAARHVTWRYPDAQLYLNFRTHDPANGPLSASDALHHLLRLLGVPLERIPATPGARSALWHSELAYRRAVIILDDVADPQQIEPLLPPEGDCLIIMTSRRRHDDWGGAGVLDLAVLPADDAVILFTKIAGPDACRDTGQLGEAMRLCGWLPLAIRVAASRVRQERTYSLTDLVEEMSDFIGRRRSDAVTQQVMATFELSYRSLPPHQRRLFRYLGISPAADISVYSAMAMTGGTPVDTESTLGALRDHHLLEQPSPGRFQFHDLVRSFAAFRCEAEDPEVERRHALIRQLDHYLRDIDHANRVLHWTQEQIAEPGRLGADRASAAETPDAAQKWLEGEWRNILRIAAFAARHERKRQCADLTHAIGEFLQTNGYWTDALAAHALALEACRDIDDLAGIARAAFDLSFMSLRTGDNDAAFRHAGDALAAYRALDDLRGQAAALGRLGIIHRHFGRFRDALAYHQEAIDLWRRTDDVLGMAQALSNAGITYSDLGRYAEAAPKFDQALKLYRQVGDRRGEAKELNNIGSVLDEQGFHRDAMRNYLASLEIFLKISNRPNISLLGHNIGRVHHYKGNYEDALSAYRMALATYRAIGDLEHQAHAFCDIGSAYYCMECPSEALIHHEKALAIADKIGDPRLRVTALCGMAEVHRDCGRHGVALDQYDKAIRLAREIEQPYTEAKALQGMGETMLRTGRLDTARIYWRQALDIFQQLGVPEAQTVAIRLDTGIAADS
jgi:tetratricopeptide (TPR) repeat protein/DNA-binding SARP family transcriptional activator